MKKTIITLTLLAGISLNLFAQREIPMFFDKEMRLQTRAYAPEVTYSPDGSKIVIADSKGRISIWDATTGKEIRRLSGNSNIVFSPNGRFLASFGTIDPTIKIWDTQSFVLLRSINQSSVEAMTFSPDGTRIAGAIESGNIFVVKIWNAANGNEIRTLTGHTSLIWSVRYSPDGKQIVTASTDRSIRIWDAENGQNIRTISGGTLFPNAVYSPNGQFIAAYATNWGNNIDAIRIYNAATGQELRLIPAKLDSFDIIYSTDGKTLLVNTLDDNNNGFIKIFDPNTGHELRSLNNGDSAVAFSPDGRKIITASETFEFKIGDTNYGASYASILDATTGRTIGTIGYGPLNVGAKAFADLQIARFLNNTAEVSKNEAVLKFITDKGYATRQEIEAFYRDNVRALIARVVDEEFGKVKIDNMINDNMTLIQFYASLEKEGALKDNSGKAVNGITLIKETLTNFFLNPTQANYENIRGIYARFKGAYYLGCNAYEATIRALNETLFTNKLKTEVTNNNAGALAKIPSDLRYNIFSNTGTKRVDETKYYVYVQFNGNRYSQIKKENNPKYVIILGDFSGPFYISCVNGFDSKNNPILVEPIFIAERQVVSNGTVVLVIKQSISITMLNQRDFIKKVGILILGEIFLDHDSVMGRNLTIDGKVYGFDMVPSLIKFINNNGSNLFDEYLMDKKD
jgi:WD40 repeat protein